MLKIFILLFISLNLITSCSIKKKEEILTTLNCPKHLIISSADSKLFSNNVKAEILNNTDLSCYISNIYPDKVIIKIKHNYKISNMPMTQYFDSHINLLVFITNRDENIKITSESLKVYFSNHKTKSTEGQKSYIQVTNINSNLKLLVNFKDYSNGLRIFSALDD